MTEMDLTKKFPRSPFDMLAGIVMLSRTIDKAKAFNAKKLGEYHYNCPLDKALFEFLDVDDVEFARKIKDLDSDEKIEKWAKSRLSKKVKEEKDQFNNWMRHNVPDSSDKLKWMESEKKRLRRSDYFSYFDNIDADEKRF